MSRSPVKRNETEHTKRFGTKWRDTVSTTKRGETKHFETVRPRNGLERAVFAAAVAPVCRATMQRLGTAQAVARDATHRLGQMKQFETKRFDTKREETTHG